MKEVEPSQEVVIEQSEGSSPTPETRTEVETVDEIGDISLEKLHGIHIGK